jgi:hypothetical protein
MAIRSGTNGSGQQVFRGRMADLTALNDWCRSIYHVAYGSYEGEQRFKSLRFIDAISLWLNQSNNEDSYSVEK